MALLFVLVTLSQVQSVGKTYNVADLATTATSVAAQSSAEAAYNTENTKLGTASSGLVQALAAVKLTMDTEEAALASKTGLVALQVKADDTA